MSTPILLYDGTCGLCAWSVQFVLRHDGRRLLRFASLEGPCARTIVARHPELRHLDTVVWYEPGEEDGRHERVLTRSAAVLEVLRYLGGPWRLGLAAAALPRSWRDALYGLLAHHRHRAFGEACLVPPPADRERFLD